MKTDAERLAEIREKLLVMLREHPACKQLHLSLLSTDELLGIVRHELKHYAAFRNVYLPIVHKRLSAAGSKRVKKLFEGKET